MVGTGAALDVKTDEQIANRLHKWVELPPQSCESRGKEGDERKVRHSASDCADVPVFDGRSGRAIGNGDEDASEYADETVVGGIPAPCPGCHLPQCEQQQVVSGTGEVSLNSYAMDCTPSSPCPEDGQGNKFRPFPSSSGGEPPPSSSSPAFPLDSRLLDPGAREFKPRAPSGTLHTEHLAVAANRLPLDGGPATLEIGSTQFLYPHELGGTAAVLPVYADPPPIHMGYASGIPACSSNSVAWDGHQQGATGRQGDQFNSTAALLPPPVLIHQQSQLPLHLPLAEMASPYGITPPPLINGPLNCTPSGLAFHATSVAPYVPRPSVGRDHMSRSLQLIGVPGEISEAQVRQEMEVWGEIRALQLEGKSEGIITAHYFDLRSARAALTDIQHQHLMQQRRMQQLYRIQQRQQQPRGQDADDSILQFEASQFSSSYELPCSVETDSTRGLIGGKAVWAQYTIPVGLPTNDSHNQGTLVVFNLDVDMRIDVVRAIFERYGTVKELRETPSKRQHKFVEFFDIRDAASALIALDGQEIGGKKVKIEFSRPGGQARRARTHGQLGPQAFQAQPCTGTFELFHASATVRGQPILMGTAQMSYMWSNYGSVPAAAPFTQLPPLNEPQAFFQGSGAFGLQIHPSPYAPIHGGATEDIQQPCLAGAGRTRATPGATQRALSAYGRGGGGGRGGKAGAAGAFESAPRRRRTNAFLGSSDWRSGVTHRNGGAGPSILPDAPCQYKFDETEAEAGDGNARTTLMIRNIPNKYSQQMLLALLDEHCLQYNSQITEPNKALSAYDFVYLPIDFKNRCNLGYAFVNFTTAQATLRVHKAFEGRQWEEFNSRKICEVTYARVQGRIALEEHFRNSRFACDTDEYLPLVFSPPRTGLESSPPRAVAVQILPVNDAQNDDSLRSGNSSNDAEAPHSSERTRSVDNAAAASPQRRTLGAFSSTSSDTVTHGETRGEKSWGIALGRRLSSAHHHNHKGILHHHPGQRGLL